MMVKITERHIEYHLFFKPVPISTALMDVASQENCDGPEHDLMVEAAKYIRELIEIINSEDC